MVTNSNFHYTNIDSRYKSFWSFIKYDYFLSKLIQFILRKGKKEKYISVLFRVLYALKIKFGINPIFLLKLVILRYNIPYKIVKIYKGKKVFYHVRFLDFYKQLRQCISNFIKVLFSLKSKRKLFLRNSFFLMILNHSVSFLKDKENSFSSKYNFTNTINNVSNKKKSFSSKRKKVQVNRQVKFNVKKLHRWINLFYELDHRTTFARQILNKCIAIYYSWKYLWYQLYCIKKFLFKTDLTRFFHFLKKVSSHLFFNLCKLRLIYRGILVKNYYKIFLGRLIEIRQLRFFHKKRVERIRRKAGLKRFFYSDQKTFSMYGNRPKSNINMKPFFRFQEEVNKNQRLHSVYHIKYRQRDIFLRKSKFGMNDIRSGGGG
uniref:40S ribosomal protein S7 n=1 Tax=Pleurostomum flabellatum TaxID=405751 RepID=A0A7T0M406_9EUKA|nr:40S ribosomal protein S7 [Pleurostomum flabellatum]QPL15600.1 40S ribosomal protein S7 [Pleurostomum flabellatum]